MDRPLGEVVASSIASFTAQCHELGAAPDLGTLVTTSEGGVHIYAVVCNAATASIDPGRRAIALGAGESEEEAVYRAHPELDQLLRTDFDALVVGCRVDGRLREYLPPRPARMHAFVGAASDDEVRELTGPLLFLHFLVNSPVPTADSALTACLRQAGALYKDPEEFRVRAGKVLAELLGRDLPRLNVLLRQLKE